jgi:hypothetical protein
MVIRHPDPSLLCIYATSFDNLPRQITKQEIRQEGERLLLAREKLAASSWPFTCLCEMVDYQLNCEIIVALDAYSMFSPHK